MAGTQGGLRGILVVEDHPELRQQLGEALTQLGFEVRLAADGEQAMELLQQFRPRLVCLDLCLPEISGYEVCDYVRSDPELQDTVVLVMSGRTLPMDRAYAMEAGADAFLEKPFALPVLLAELQRLLNLPLRHSVAA